MQAGGQYAFKIMTYNTEKSREFLFHLRWVSKIAIWIGGTAAIGLIVVLFFLTGHAGTSYEELIRAGSLTQHQLGPALLVGGFFLVSFGAILTWLITLYSSFRVAGPLFRLTHNLKASIGHRPEKPISIRSADRLHPEAILLEKSLEVLANHYRGLQSEVDHALQRLDAGDLTAADRQAICERLKSHLDHARF